MKIVEPILRFYDFIQFTEITLREAPPLAPPSGGECEMRLTNVYKYPLTKNKHEEAPPLREGLQAKQLIIVLFGGRQVRTLFCEPYEEIPFNKSGWGVSRKGTFSSCSESDQNICNTPNWSDPEIRLILYHDNKTIPQIRRLFRMTKWFTKTLLTY